MTLIFAKIFSVFSISLIGYIANRIRWLPVESTRYLSLLLINIASPCLVVYSMSQQELSPETVSSVVQTAGLMILALAAASMIAFFIVKLMKTPIEDRSVYQVTLVLPNCGFMGFPLSLAVFGEKGLFLTIIANAVFTLYVYSAGVLMLISGRSEKLTLKTAVKSMISTPVVSSVAGLLIFALGIRLPDLLAEFLNTVGGITIPLSMIIIGIQLAESRVGEVLNNKHIYETLVLKLAILPAILFGIFMWLPVSPFVLCIVIFAMAMPSAAVIPVLAEVHGVNAKLAAQAVFVTTMFSLASIPIFAVLLNHYLNGGF
jgi:predicted permease